MGTNTSLKRSLGLWAIVALGLGYMTPTVVFDTFGIVSKQTGGLVPLAYVVGLIVMLFTAISYGKMVKVFPSAGSAYTYTRETMGPRLGFLVGWASLLDYLLLPLVNAVIIRLYMESLFPDTSAWIWVLIYVAFVTVINAISMKSTSGVNVILVVFTLVLMAAFVVLGSIQLYKGMGTGTLLTIQPLFQANMHITAVLTGATVVCFSFIGFDAITMYTEEAKDINIMPKAIAFTVLIGGAVFFVGAYFAQTLFPDVSVFNVVDDTLPEIALYVGGVVFQLIFLSGAFAATIASGLASHSSVSRLLFVMGRNGVLPKRLFGYVHPKFRTPFFNVIFVGIVSLLAMGPSLELISAVINFGALIAFTFVNLSVIAYFVFKKKQYQTPKQVFSYIVMPTLGAAFTGVLWAHLHADAFIGGIVWVIIGVIYMFIMYKVFKKDITDLGVDEADQIMG
ncbi:amino acid-amine transporter [Siminovitchia terrae]|uniref:APC family permease n=1 Tax=Siminovitchia terrae TaxID=1914933 RepID=UPI001B27E3DD|nr:APC family permease [Siminovitchia terrae]GIN93568.1 amino acid-amine transporter [Siminovitchia terrae]